MKLLTPIAVAMAQLALALLWTAYAVMLPGLVESAGLPKGALPPPPLGPPREGTPRNRSSATRRL